MEMRAEVGARPHEAEDTRERILAAAQKLFAEKGFEATSVRDITTAAGCNVASVNYHFGGKDNLYLETFRSLLTLLRDHRLGVLDELLVRSPAPTLEEFLESFARGFLDPIVEERHLMALMTWEMFNPRMPREVFAGEFIQPLLGRVSAALARFGPPLDRGTVRLTVMSLIGQLLHAIKAYQMFTAHERSEPETIRVDDYVRHFVQFSAAGIRACAEASPVAVEANAARPAVEAGS